MTKRRAMPCRTDHPARVPVDSYPGIIAPNRLGRTIDGPSTRTAAEPHAQAFLQGEPGRPGRDRAVVAARRRCAGGERRVEGRGPPGPAGTPLPGQGEAGDLPPPDRFAP